MRKRNQSKAKRRPIDKERIKKEDQFLRDCRSSNGSTSMCSEPLKPPGMKKFVRHVSKKTAPAVKLSLRELADAMYPKE